MYDIIFLGNMFFQIATNVYTKYMDMSRKHFYYSITQHNNHHQLIRFYTSVKQVKYAFAVRGFDLIT